MDNNVMRTITEPARQIPVLMDVDVVVVGTTGPLAAISAARRGKSGCDDRAFRSLVAC